MNNHILITIFCSQDPSRRYLASIVLVAFNFEPLLTEFICTIKCWEDQYDCQDGACTFGAAMERRPTS
jgi:hypothetical protein